jgi:hypothetical protein
LSSIKKELSNDTKLTQAVKILKNSIKKNPNKREVGFSDKIDQMSSSRNIDYILNMMDDSEKKLMEPHITNDPKLADPSRFRFDSGAFRNYLSTASFPDYFPDNIKDMIIEEDAGEKTIKDENLQLIEREPLAGEVYNNFSKYNIGVNDHPLTDGKSELDLLEESIEKTHKAMNSDDKFFFEEYLIGKIGSNPEAMKAYESIKELKSLSMKNPTWFNVAFHRVRDGRVKNFTQEDVLNTEDLSKLTYYDEDIDKKQYRINSKGKPHGSTNFPVTPHLDLMRFIGKGPYKLDPEQKETARAEAINELYKKSNLSNMSIEDFSNNLTDQQSDELRRIVAFKENVIKRKYNKLVESLNEDIHSLDNKIEELESKNDKSGVADLKLEKEILVGKQRVAKSIRENLATKHHSDDDSFFKLYDNICNEYLNYHTERYGPAPFIRRAAFAQSTDDPNRVVFHRSSTPPASLVNVFKPLPRGDGLIELTLSAQPTDSPDFKPSLISTNLHKINFGEVDEHSDIKEKLSNADIKTIRFNVDKYEELTLPTNQLDMFFNKLISGNISLYLESPVGADGSYNSADTGSVSLLTGKNSYQDRYQGKTTSREVINSKGKKTTYAGFGEPRMSLGKKGTYNKAVKPQDISSMNYGFDDKSLDVRSNIDESINSMIFRFGLGKEAGQMLKDKFPTSFKPMSHQLSRPEVIADLQKSEAGGNIIISALQQKLIIEIVDSAGGDVSGLLPDGDSDHGNEVEMVKQASSSEENNNKKRSEEILSKKEKEAYEKFKENSIEATPISDEDMENLNKEKEEILDEMGKKLLEKISERLNTKGPFPLSVLGDYADRVVDSGYIIDKGQVLNVPKDYQSEYPVEYPLSERDVKNMGMIADRLNSKGVFPTSVIASYLDRMNALGYIIENDKVMNVPKEYQTKYPVEYPDVLTERDIKNMDMIANRINTKGVFPTSVIASYLDRMNALGYIIENDKVMNVPKQYQSKYNIKHTEPEWESVSSPSEEDIEKVPEKNVDTVNTKDTTVNEIKKDPMNDIVALATRELNEFLRDKYWQYATSLSQNGEDFEENVSSIQAKTPEYFQEFMSLSKSQKYNQAKDKALKKALWVETDNIYDRFKEDYSSQSDQLVIDDMFIAGMDAEIGPEIIDTVKRAVHEGALRKDIKWRAPYKMFQWLYYRYLNVNQIALNPKNAIKLFSEFQLLCAKHIKDVYDSSNMDDPQPQSPTEPVSDQSQADYMLEQKVLKEDKEILNRKVDQVQTPWGNFADSEDPVI